MAAAFKSTLAFDVRNPGVPSVGESVAAFNLYIRPLWRGRRTRGKYETHRLGLPFEASLPVMSHCIAVIKAWHQRLAMRATADGPGDYRRLTRPLAAKRFLTV